MLSRSRKQIAWAALMVPIFPDFTNSIIFRVPDMLRLCTPIWHMRPSFRAHCVITRPSSTLWLQGFST